MHRWDGRLAWPTIVWLSLLVCAFVVLSLLVTAAGAARFAVAMGYGAAVGFAVGAIFDLAKGSLLIGVHAFWARRSLLFATIFALIWVCLVTFSCLATHAMVMTAISSIERMGTWRMEVRGNTKAELATIEQQLGALSRPMPPRPAQTVREALSAERVPGSVWQDSHECAKIQDSTYFAKACAQVVQLRRELAASEDYERLSGRAAEMRKALAEAPIVATSDPLPDAFSATLGRVLPVSGKDGVALLLTAVIELMSAFGFAGLRLLANAKATGPADTGSLQVAVSQGASPSALARPLPRQRQATLPKPSLLPTTPEGGMVQANETREISNPPSNVLPQLSPCRPPQTLLGKAAGRGHGGAGYIPLAYPKVRRGMSPSCQGHVRSS